MKKSLLIIGLAFSVAASAQSRRIQSTGTTAKQVDKHKVYSEVVKGTELPAATSNGAAARHGNGGNHTTSISEIAIGTSGNCLGPAFGPKTNLWYDKDINSVAFTHRSATPTLGLYRYDVSTDGGNTWSIEHYTGGDSTDVIKGRYPHGVIYNPSGNTDPSNAFVNTFGPTTDGVATGFCNTFWNGLMSGNAPINGSTYAWTWHSCVSLGLNTLIPSGGQLVKNTGNVYWVVNGYDGTDYNDSITLIKGVFNNTTSSMDYTFQKIYMPMCMNSAVPAAKAFVDINTSWNDAGTIGYITMLGNDWSCNVEPTDSTFGLIVLKTTDGGNSWTKLGRPWLSLVDPVLLNGNFFCTTAFEHDAVVDNKNNLHVAVAIGPYAGGSSISTGAGSWGIFDVTYDAAADSWKATLLAKPGTFRGNYGDGTAAHPAIPEDSRPQASRSWDGSKIFVTWFDTDTNVFGSGVENIFRDMHSIGYDVDNDMWTAEVNHTEFSGTNLDGACNWGNVSYYTINNGTDECIPMVAGTMVSPPLSTETTLSFFYINGACMSNYVNSIPSIPLNIWQGQHEIAASGFNVSSNYPNPYTGKTSVDVSLAKAGDVTIEISNSIGQVLSTTNYKNLHAGVNTLTLDGSSLSKGLYFYTVKADSESATKTMSVE